MTTTEQRLRDLLTRRILILDGAMGTMIQRYKLTEEDYRGARFAGFVRAISNPWEGAATVTPHHGSTGPMGHEE